MSTMVIESPHTLTCGSTSIPTQEGKKFKRNPRPKLKVSTQSGVLSATPTRSRFTLALNKALIVRSRFLKRRLTSSEFKNLVSAVRKQITRKFTTTIDKCLSGILDRIRRLEIAVPQTPLLLQDSIGMFAAQVSVLREQAMLALQERDELSETCGHFSKKKVFNLKGESPYIYKTIPGLDSIYLASLPHRQVLACEGCTQKREEALFYWTGNNFSSFDNLDDDRIVSSGLSKVHPLSIPGIWSEVLNQHYNRAFITPT